MVLLSFWQKSGGQTNFSFTSGIFMKEFVHRPYIKGETIAAIATPPGEGAVAIVRISGNEALSVADKIFSGPIHSYASHTAHFGKIIDSEGKKIDEVLLLVMKAPRSYTGEDTVEIQCHGGSLVTRLVLNEALKAGARMANPGEFTFKSFMNGKLDLPQAEAVQQLIGSKNRLALQAATEQLEGRLSHKIRGYQKTIFDLAAIFEAWVDFPEEGLEFASVEEVIEELIDVKKKMHNLCATFHEGKMLHEGLSLCLVGLPNVGKSSLMNALLGSDRAIVTPIAGTTRDLIEETLKLGRLHFKLIDTAGIRESDDLIEKEGIRRSKIAFSRADLILYILDATTGITPDDLALIDDFPPEKTIAIWNKIDLSSSPLPFLPFSHSHSLSAKTGEGIDALKETIDKMVWHEGPNKEEVLLTSARHEEALRKAISAVDTVIAGLQQGISPEFLSSDIRQILVELGTIIGTNITEDILSALFSKFCVGK
jgi:tRNA modification GTPase